MPTYDLGFVGEAETDSRVSNAKVRGLWVEAAGSPSSNPTISRTASDADFPDTLGTSLINNQARGPHLWDVTNQQLIQVDCQVVPNSSERPTQRRLRIFNNAGVLVSSTWMDFSLIAGFERNASLLHIQRIGPWVIGIGILVGTGSVAESQFLFAQNTTDTTRLLRRPLAGLGLDLHIPVAEIAIGRYVYFFESGTQTQGIWAGLASNERHPFNIVLPGYNTSKRVRAASYDGVYVFVMSQAEVHAWEPAGNPDPSLWIDRGVVEAFDATNDFAGILTANAQTGTTAYAFWDASFQPSGTPTTGQNVVKHYSRLTLTTPTLDAHYWGGNPDNAFAHNSHDFTWTGHRLVLTSEPAVYHCMAADDRTGAYVFTKTTTTGNVIYAIFIDPNYNNIAYHAAAQAGSGNIVFADTDGFNVDPQIPTVTRMRN